MDEVENIIPESQVVPSDPGPGELSTGQVNQLQNLSKYNVDQFISNAEALVDFYIRARKIALKATVYSDWEVLGGSPYLKDKGVNRVLQILGASIGKLELFTDTQHEEKLGRVDYYTAKGEIVFQGRTFENIGMSSTKDAFFAKRKDHFLKWDEVDSANCKKKAVTNLKHRLLFMAFEFSPTAEELQKRFGDNFGKIGKTTYGKGNQGGSTVTKELKQKRAELGNLILKLAGGEAKEASEILISLTEWTNEKGKEIAGHSDLNYLKSEKQINFMISKVTEMISNKREPGEN